GLGGLRFLLGPARIRSVNPSPLGAASVSIFRRVSIQNRARSNLAYAVLRVNGMEVKNKFRKFGKVKFPVQKNRDIVRGAGILPAFSLTV
ncbi:MAG: hypothetical protein ACRD4Y_01360, partial [Candidatus Acidiferrales bacterium]